MSKSKSRLRHSIVSLTIRVIYSALDNQQDQNFNNKRKTVEPMALTIREKQETSKQRTRLTPLVCRYILQCTEMKTKNKFFNVIKEAVASHVALRSPPGTRGIRETIA